MSYHVHQRVALYARTRDLSEQGVLFALAGEALDADGVVEPGVPDLAKACRISERRLQELTAELARSGELYRRAGRGRGRKSRYFVASGLDEEVIADVLERRFEFPVERARKTASLMMSRRREKARHTAPFAEDKTRDAPRLFSDEEAPDKPESAISSADSAKLVNSRKPATPRTFSKKGAAARTFSENPATHRTFSEENPATPRTFSDENPAADRTFPKKKGLPPHPPLKEKTNSLEKQQASNPLTLEASPPKGPHNGYSPDEAERQPELAAAAFFDKSVIEEVRSELVTLGLAEPLAERLASDDPEACRQNAALFRAKIRQAVQAGREPPSPGLLVDAIQSRYAERDQAVRRRAVEAALAEQPEEELSTYAEALKVFDGLSGRFDEHFEPVKQPPNRDGSPGSTLFRKRKLRPSESIYDLVGASHAQMEPPPLLPPHRGSVDGKPPKRTKIRGFTDAP